MSKNRQRAIISVNGSLPDLQGAGQDIRPGDQLLCAASGETEAKAVSLTAPVAAETVNLTDEEWAVLWFTAAGQTDCQIGRALSVSERTVRRRLENIYQKLGVNTRIEAAVQAVRLGLI